MNFTMVPYGNAQRNPRTGEITCQHGPDECTLNKAQNCAIYYGETVDVWWPFVLCTEDLTTGGVDSIARCADENPGLDTDTINTCYQGPEGDALLAQAGVVTDNLDPPHTGTPWIVLQGEPLADTSDITASVCEAYTGSPKPAACDAVVSSKPRVPQGQCYKQKSALAYAFPEA
mmetsp:Transcript_2977/g.10743  ORF Transcript_2977/g.10743 Transcript_2977/m.10743 type:complete len:174 (+) Transcript_2977:193-714(+)